VPAPRQVDPASFVHARKAPPALGREHLSGMSDRVFELLGLRENPFKINPDPRYLFATPELQETVAQLTHGIQERCGFMLLTGDLGTGKTTVVHHLSCWLRDQGMPTALVCYTHVDVTQLLDLMLAGFGIPCGLKGKGDTLRSFNDWLIERYAAGETPVVVIDEAQGLRLDVLEEVCLLLNLETSRQKLLQVLLAGESSLRSKLQSSYLPQLWQRISVRRHIKPFTAEQTRGYIEARVRIARGGPTPLFSSEAIEAIHLHSRGVARVINVLCERALLNAHAEETVPVPVRIVDEVAAELLPPERKWPAAGATAASHAVLPEASASPAATGSVPTLPVHEIPAATASHVTRAESNAAVLINLMARKRVPGLPTPHADAPAPTPTADPDAAIAAPACDPAPTKLPLLPAGPAPLALPPIEPKHWDLLTPRAAVSEFRPVPPRETTAKRQENKLEMLLASSQRRAMVIGRRGLSPFRISRLQQPSQRIPWKRGRKRAEEFASSALFMAERISWYELHISAWTLAVVRKTREGLRWLQEPLGGATREAIAPVSTAAAGRAASAGPRLYWARLPRFYSPTLSRQVAAFLRWLRPPMHVGHTIRSHGARTPRGAH
jgi:general secretion pathway protein A